MAELSAAIKGASEIYCVDREAGRLRLAEQAGAIPINLSRGDPVEQIKERRRQNQAWRAASDRASGETGERRA